MKKNNNFFMFFLVGILGILLAAVIGWFVLIGPGMNHGPVMNHGSMDHSSSTSSNVDTTPAVEVQSDATIRILAEGETKVFPLEIVDQIKGLDGIKDVYTYLSLKTDAGEINGVDVNKELVIESEGKLVIPSLVEGRFLQKEDNGKNFMLVGKTFAGSHQTDLGYPILGMVSAHPTDYSFDNNDMKIVGIFGGVSEGIENQVILPLETAQRLYQYNQEQGVNLIYVTLNDSGSAEEISNKIKTVLDGSGSIEVIG
jgi:ABC-type lipoprotein release transport system permease subunit